MRNPSILGQIPIREGSGFMPGSWFWPGSFGPMPAAQGVTRKVNELAELEDEPHCYGCSDGTFKTLTAGEASELEAEGLSCRRVNARNCSKVVRSIYPASVLGQEDPPAPPPPSGGNGGGDGDGNGDGGGGEREDRFIFPPFARFPFPPHIGPRGRRKLICRRDEDMSEEEGEDVFVCERDEPEEVVAEPRFPVYFLRPFGF